MDDKISLPASSYRELTKIIQGYALRGDQAALDDLSKLIGVPRTRISGNNKFLTEIGLITPGKKKGPTELGRKLGRALEHDQDEEARSAWVEAIKSSEPISGLVTTVRIKGGMKSDALAQHVLYVSGQRNTSGNRTGARAVIDVLLSSGLLEEDDGVVRVVASQSSIPEEDTEEVVDPGSSSTKEDAPDDESSVERKAASVTTQVTSSNQPSIAINIQLHLPETESAEVYEKLFSALRRHLIDGEGNE